MFVVISKSVPSCAPINKYKTFPKSLTHLCESIMITNISLLITCACQSKLATTSFSRLFISVRKKIKRKCVLVNIIYINQPGNDLPEEVGYRVLNMTIEGVRALCLSDRSNRTRILVRVENGEFNEIHRDRQHVGLMCFLM